MVYSLLTNTGFAGEIPGSILEKPILMGGRGLYVPLLLRGFDVIRDLCDQHGLEYGIRFKDSRILGDIVELSGPDYKDLTKKAVLDISRAMVA